jgi:hypothetical protein
MTFPASGLYARLVCQRPLWLSSRGGELEIEQEVSYAWPRLMAAFESLVSQSPKNMCNQALIGSR